MLRLPAAPFIYHSRIGAAGTYEAVIMIRRRGGPPQEEESSSEEEGDAFSALSSQNNKTKAPAAKPKTATDTTAASTENNITTKPPASLPVKNTSSMKRHHGMTDSRKAKMDALLQELQVDNASASQRQRSFVPEKKGSFVQPGEEHLTTNIFVGNLAPSITEEMMIDLFRQFGEDLRVMLSCGNGLSRVHVCRRMVAWYCPSRDPSMRL